MMFLGYSITAPGQAAGIEAIRAQKGLFSSRTIGKAIEPYVHKTSKVWPRTTRFMAATAAAEQLIFDAVRDGKIISGGAIVGVPQWRRKP